MWLPWLLACTGPAADTDKVIDGDGDGFDERYDCDDTNAEVYPTAPELCDGIDNNCDGITDDPSAEDAPSWYADGDGDGYGNSASSTVGCTPPPGFIAQASDCDDSDAAANPGAEEVCDGIDNDCDGEIDDDPVDIATWHRDHDGDGYGDDNDVVEGCSPGSGWVTTDGDCDDTTAAIYPGAAEVCGDGLVNACESTTAAARAACAWSSVLDEGDADAIISPSGSGGQPGWSIASGDINGDGQGDLLIGAPGGDDTWMMLGPITADRDFTTSQSLYNGDAGLAVQLADADGDGYDDLLTGGGEGAWVAWGPLTAGQALAASDIVITAEGAGIDAADLDGLGAPDLVVGAPGDGAVYLFDGDRSGTYAPEDAAFTLSGSSSTGATLAVAGDLDGDGIDELLIGAPSASSGGAAWLVQGPISADQSLSSSDAWTATGWASLTGAALSGLGDLDGDGYSDFAIGAPAADFYSGAVGIWFGGETLPAPADITDADLLLVGDYGMLFGGDVHPAGDIDLDGLPDVVIGSGHGVSSGGSAPVNDGPAEAYLFLTSGALSSMTGSRSLDDADVRFEGPQRSFGLRAAGIGDISGDGRADLFFSSGESAEENYLFFGTSE